MVRKFLYVVAFLTALAIAGMIAFSFFGSKLMRSALVPHVGFSEPQALPTDIYARPEGWISRPDGRRDDPARWQPANAAPLTLPEGGGPDETGKAAIFFVHPTSAFDTLHWNASLGDRIAAAQAARFVRLQATAFAPSGAVWVPRYRQAVFGAFLTDKADAALALDRAYADVKAAFAAFLVANPTGPLILAGHSQGSRHLLHLLRDHAGDAGLRQRIVAVYAVGWPVSVAHDLPALGLPACTSADQTGCLLSWQSFAQPADTSAVETTFDRERGFDGQSRKGSAMLCTNPLTGGGAADARAEANLGTLMGDGEPLSTQLVAPGMVGAHCEERGFLMLDGAPRLGTYMLPGNNYHVYDYPLFWANIRADAARRLVAWQTTR
ncbi:MAG: hypothetical protein BGP16_13260 [Sphingobium sp. 66-54]|nr:MAG: hypothetical protein BGP16_13260 [Sphingobium sp. 66-54]